MRILILEDDKERQVKFLANFAPGNEILLVATAEGCIAALRDQHWDILFLDHDLGDKIMVESGPGTGYEVACWLEQNIFHVPEIVVVHSFNPDGASRIQAALSGSVRLPGAWDMPLDRIVQFARAQNAEEI